MLGQPFCASHVHFKTGFWPGINGWCWCGTIWLPLSYELWLRNGLHAGCPVEEGQKWSANYWVWNKPRSFEISMPDADADDEYSGHLATELVCQAALSCTLDDGDLVAIWTRRDVSGKRGSWSGQQCHCDIHQPRCLPHVLVPVSVGHANTCSQD